VLQFANPVRRIFSDVPDWRAPEPGGSFHIFVMGGSQGAISLNDAVLELVPFLKHNSIELTHQTGSRDLERIQQKYRELDFDKVQTHSFIDDIASVYSRAHLVICRAGAMSVAEVSASGRPAIYVPLPIAGGHQAENAQHIVAAQGAEMIVQDSELGEKLQKSVDLLIKHPDKLREMGRIAREISSVGAHSSAEELARCFLNFQQSQTGTT